jgi:hypothetical protein
MMMRRSAWQVVNRKSDLGVLVETARQNSASSRGSYETGLLYTEKSTTAYYLTDFLFCQHAMMMAGFWLCMISTKFFFFFFCDDDDDSVWVRCGCGVGVGRWGQVWDGLRVMVGRRPQKRLAAPDVFVSSLLRSLKLKPGWLQRRDKMQNRRAC